jgi:hypothetical protein
VSPVAILQIFRRKRFIQSYYMQSHEGVAIVEAIAGHSIEEIVEQYIVSTSFLLDGLQRGRSLATSMPAAVYYKSG